MDIGYIRVSTAEQNTDRQDIALRFCSRLYKEKVSGKNAKRPQLQLMLSEVKEGDVVWITELSRLGRSNIDLCQIAGQLRDKGVALRSLKENIDLTSATGVFTFQIFSAMAEFERAIIKERQAEGIAAAQRKIALGEKRAWGRPATVEIPEEYFLRVESGEITSYQACREIGLPDTCMSTFYRRYKTWKKQRDLRAELLQKEVDRRREEAAEEMRKVEAEEAKKRAQFVISESVVED